jgi:hypothetical protein
MADLQSMETYSNNEYFRSNMNCPRILSCLRVDYCTVTYRINSMNCDQDVPRATSGYVGYAARALHYFPSSLVCSSVSCLVALINEEGNVITEKIRAPCSRAWRPAIEDTLRFKLRRKINLSHSEVRAGNCHPLHSHFLRLLISWWIFTENSNKLGNISLI